MEVRYKTALDMVFAQQVAGLYCNPNEDEEKRMSTLRILLSEAIANSGFSTWGVADISGLHPFADEFPKALSVALSYDIPFNTYDEPSYHALTVQVRQEFDLRFAALVDFLLLNNVRHFVPVVAPTDDGKDLPVFPHKVTATRAGLGWIGKSTLLVTPEYGPRVRLGTILLADDLEADLPVTASSCGSCDRCAEACPNDAIHNVLWQPDTGTVPLFSMSNCGKRKAFVDTIGRSHSCGLCLLACPVGTGLQ
jgi:epoxyqueuosine reductase